MTMTNMQTGTLIQFSHLKVVHCEKNRHKDKTQKQTGFLSGKTETRFRL